MKITLSLKGRPKSYVNMIIQEQGITPERIFTDALSLYIEAYENRDKELAFVKGDLAIRKLNTLSMWSKNN